MSVTLLDPDGRELPIRRAVADASRALSMLDDGARVVVMLPNGLQLAATMLACFERGLVAVPIDPGTGATRRSFIEQHSEAAASIDGSGVRLLQGGGPSEPDDRLIIYTSGTTGDPKGVVLTRVAIEANARAVAALHRFDAAAHATCLPLWHVNALCMSLMGTHLTSGRLLIAEDASPGAYFRAIAACRAATCSVVPSVLARIVEDAPAWPDSLDYVITAAAPLTSRLARRFHALYGPRLVQGYGLSEATNFSTLMPRLPDATFRQLYLDRHPPVGVPLPGTSLRVVDGEVQVRGPNLMRGYWKSPDATAAVHDGEWLRTGDLGRVEDGVLHLNGRSKDVILRGGESLYPTDVEEELRDAGMPGRDLCVFAVESEWLGQEIGVSISGADPDEVLRALQRVRASRRPTVIRFGPVTRTSTGKPRRTAMPFRPLGFSFPASSRGTSDDEQALLDRCLATFRRANARAGATSPSPCERRPMAIELQADRIERAALDAGIVRSLLARGHAEVGLCIVRRGRSVPGAVIWAAGATSLEVPAHDPLEQASR